MRALLSNTFRQAMRTLVAQELHTLAPKNECTKLLYMNSFSNPTLRQLLPVPFSSASLSPVLSRSKSTGHLLAVISRDPVSSLKCRLSFARLATVNHTHSSLTTLRSSLAKNHRRMFSSTPDSDAAVRARQRAALAARAKEKSGSSSTSAAYYLVALIIGMVGMTYASVPLYRLFCQATGYGGTITRVRSVEEKLAEQESMDAETTQKIQERHLKITFNSDVTDGMQWKFTPSQREVRVVPGQTVLAFYKAHNFSDEAITGVSTYNVTPMKAGQYFNKIQCFCFEEQRLRAGEQVDMPVFFYIDPEFALDPKMKGVDTITLSYTFFPSNTANVTAEA